MAPNLTLSWAECAPSSEAPAHTSRPSHHADSAFETLLANDVAVHSGLAQSDCVTSICHEDALATLHAPAEEIHSLVVHSNPSANCQSAHESVTTSVDMRAVPSDIHHSSQVNCRIATMPIGMDASPGNPTRVAPIRAQDSNSHRAQYHYSPLVHSVVDVRKRATHVSHPVDRNMRECVVPQPHFVPCQIEVLSARILRALVRDAHRLSAVGEVVRVMPQQCVDALLHRQAAVVWADDAPVKLVPVVAGAVAAESRQRVAMAALEVCSDEVVPVLRLPAADCFSGDCCRVACGHVPAPLRHLGCESAAAADAVVVVDLQLNLVQRQQQRQRVASEPKLRFELESRHLVSNAVLPNARLHECEYESVDVESRLAVPHSPVADRSTTMMMHLADRIGGLCDALESLRRDSRQRRRRTLVRSSQRVCTLTH